MQALNFPRWNGELTTVWPDRPTPTPPPPARLFLGQVVATPGALEVLDHATATAILRRHMLGDWGDLDFEDKEMNDRAIENNDRVLSSYNVEGTWRSSGQPFRLWVITEADRSATTILLPEEYY